MNTFIFTKDTLPTSTEFDNLFHIKGDIEDSPHLSMCDSLEIQPKRRALASPLSTNSDLSLCELQENHEEDQRYSSNQFLRGVAQELVQLEKNFKRQCVNKLPDTNLANSKILSFKSILKLSASKGTTSDSSWEFPNQSFDVYLPFMRDFGDVTLE
jgi:hypothetical protein